MIPCPYVLPLIVYVHARHRNCWHFTTRKPKVLHLSRQTHRHNKAASMNALHFTTRQLLIQSKLTQMTGAEKRQEIQTDETAKESRAPLPLAASSHASSMGPSGERQEQLVRSSKQARTAKKGAATCQDVSYLFQKEHCEHQRNGFLQVRMAGMRKCIKKKVFFEEEGR